MGSKPENIFSCDVPASAKFVFQHKICYSNGSYSLGSLLDVDFTHDLALVLN